MAKKIVTNVSANPVTLADGTTINAGEAASVDGALLKDDMFYAAGLLKDGQVEAADESATVAELRAQIDGLEKNVADLTEKNAELSQKIGDESARADSAEATISDAKAKK